jgi:hypothetical protein
MNKLYILFFCVLFAITSCKNETFHSGSKKMAMNNTSTIITESDSAYLGNIVADITKNNTTNTKQEVSKIIQKVDSVKEASAIANTESNDVSGTNIECKDFKVTISVLMNQSGDHYTIANIAELNNAQIQVNGLLEPKIEQRFFTKVQLAFGTEKYVLHELLENANPWLNLPANINVFASADNINLLFRDIDAKSILLASDRALRKAGKGRKELEDLKKALVNTKKYSDAPCSVIATAIHYKISGKKNGKKVSETIKISL